jgi:hypothetical protein
MKLFNIYYTLLSFFQEKAKEKIIFMMVRKVIRQWLTFKIIFVNKIKQFKTLL